MLESFSLFSFFSCLLVIFYCNRIWLDFEKEKILKMLPKFHKNLSRNRFILMEIDLHWSCESTYNSKELQFKHDKRRAWFNISHQFSIQKFIPFNHIPNRSSFEVPVHHIIQYPSNKSQKSVLFDAIGLNARIWHSFQTEKYWNFTSDHSITPQTHAKTTLRANIQVKICPKSKPHREMLCQTKW